LRQALLWPVPVEVGHAVTEDAPPVALAQEEHLVEALVPPTAEKALGDGGGPQRALRRAQNHDATCLRHLRDYRPDPTVSEPDR
jgi:hypothetical protein